MSNQPETFEQHAENHNDPNAAQPSETESADRKDKLAAMLPGLCMIAMLIALVVWGLLDTR
jgi:hypothetical protein